MKKEIYANVLAALRGSTEARPKRLYDIICYFCNVKKITPSREELNVLIKQAVDDTAITKAGSWYFLGLSAYRHSPYYQQTYVDISEANYQRALQEYRLRSSPDYSERPKPDVSKVEGIRIIMELERRDFFEEWIQIDLSRDVEVLDLLFEFINGHQLTLIIRDMRYGDSEGDVIFWKEGSALRSRRSGHHFYPDPETISEAFARDLALKVLRDYTIKSNSWAPLPLPSSGLNALLYWHKRSMGPFEDVKQFQ